MPLSRSRFNNWFLFLPALLQSFRFRLCLVFWHPKKNFERLVCRICDCSASCVVCCFLFFCLWLNALAAVPVGNPALPSLLQKGIFIPDTFWCNGQIGFVKDALFLKRFAPSESSRVQGVHRATLRGASATAIVAWSIRERFNFQIEAGSGQYVWQFKQQQHWVRGRSSNGLLWAGNGKIVVLDIKDTSFAFDVHAGGENWMSGPASINGVAQKKQTNSQFLYWQIGAALTQRIGLFSPYLGVAINHTHYLIEGVPLGKKRLKSRHFTGPFGGCSLGSTEPFLLNLEWRGWFEEGLSLSGQLRF